MSPDDFSNAGFPHYTHRRVEVGPTLVRAARLSYVGELGWELTIPSESAVPVFDDLCEAGGGLGLKLAGTEALSSLRIEKGYRAWDHEIGPDDTPLQAGLEFAVCFNKSASFLGKKTLLRQQTEGVSRRLVQFTLADSNAHPHSGEPIWWQDTLVGRTNLRSLRAHPRLCHRAGLHPDCRAGTGRDALHRRLRDRNRLPTLSSPSHAGGCLRF